MKRGVVRLPDLHRVLRPDRTGASQSDADASHARHGHPVLCVGSHGFLLDHRAEQSGDALLRSGLQAKYVITGSMRNLAAAVSALLAVAAPAASQPAEESSVSLAQIEGLSPAQTGDLMLQGREHGEVVAIWSDVFGLQPPGTVDLFLAETPERLEMGCSRVLWRGTVPRKGEFELGGAVSPRFRAERQVALSPNLPCELAQYADLRGEADSARIHERRAIALIGAVRALSDDEQLEFRCENEVPGEFCERDHLVRGTMRNQQVSSVRPGSDRVNGEVTLGDYPRTPLVEVTLDGPDDTAVKIRRFVPPPA